MYPASTRREARQLLASGMTLSAVSRELGVSRSTLREWQAGRQRHLGCCPRCDDESLAEEAYSALLGFYLGDGCISRAARYHSLRVSCDATWPGIVEDVERCLTGVRPGARVFRVRAPGVVVVTCHWKHWPCLFPQHGPGRKHERPIVLEDWQRAVVEAHPAEFLRGLFHSDGCRVGNRATRTVDGRVTRHDYPRWQFRNSSEDIHALCGWALDLVDVPWRRSGPRTLSVSTRAGVARLDALVGLKG